MNEKDFERMLERAREKKDQDRERFQAASERRQRVLERAIATQRVRVDYERVSDDFDPRAHFQQKMRQAMNQHAKDVDLSELLGDEDDE